MLVFVGAVSVATALLDPLAHAGKAVHLQREPLVDVPVLSRLFSPRARHS
jgi:hypothetical protein